VEPFANPTFNFYLGTVPLLLSFAHWDDPLDDAFLTDTISTFEDASFVLRRIYPIADLAGLLMIFLPVLIL